MNGLVLLLYTKLLRKGNGQTRLRGKLLHGITPSLVLSEGAAFMLTHKIVDLHIGEVSIYSYTAAESDEPQSFKQVAVCPEISGEFYKLSDYTGTKFRGGNKQHT